MPPLHIQAEKATITAVSEISTFVNEYRSVPSFNPSTIPKTKKKPSFYNDDPVTDIFTYLSQSKSNVSFDANTDNIDKEETRNILVNDIILPLVENLIDSYTTLDSFSSPEHAVKQIPPKLRNAKPPAPPGLLSLANYTDIAVLCELLTNYAILSNLLPNILYPANVRIAMLPKTLLGRLSRKSYSHFTSISSLDNQGNQMMRAAGIALAKLIMLPRFFMLFPRHIHDIYAVILSTKSSIDKSDSGLHIFDRFTEPWDKNPKQQHRISIIIAIKSIQHLLHAGPTKTPPFMKKKCGSILTILCQKDLIRVLDCYVIAQDSASAMRFAQLLHNLKELNEKEVCNQLIEALTADKVGHVTMEYIKLESSSLERIDFAYFWETLMLSHADTQDDQYLVMRKLVCLVRSCPTSQTQAFCLTLLSKDVFSILYPVVFKHICSVIRDEKHTEEEQGSIEIMMFLLESISCKDGKEETKAKECIQLGFLHLISAVDRHITKETKSHLEGACAILTQSEAVLDLLQKSARVVMDLVQRLTKAEMMTSELFQFLLSVYLENLHNRKITPESKTSMPSFLRSPTAKMACLSILQKLMESSDIAVLLNQGDGVLEIMGIVFHSAAIAIVTDTDDVKMSEFTFNWIRRGSIDLIALEANYDNCKHNSEADASHGKEEDDTLLSVASLSLSLFIAMLELGPSKRLFEKDEIMIKSFLPSLERFSSPSASMIDPGIAEMSTHACALIVSRSAMSQALLDKNQSCDTDGPIPMHERIRFASSDLEMSNSPPIRARGVVSLRHIARSLTPSSNIPILIAEVESNVEVPSNNNVLDDMLQITIMKALKDSESYVYLAGIQTLSVLADVDPKYVIPILACAVSRGTLSRGGKSGDSPLLLELDIQIKAAESLLFVIKRRGSALAQHANGLINELLVGCQSREEIPSRPNSNFTGQDMREIQEQTLSYFETASDSVINLQQDEKDEDLEEKMVRLKTGGPLFETEEHFAINSGCLLCLSEIIMTVPSNVFAPHHGSTLIKLCIECLRLDKNRPVRRGAALLAREIYNVVLRDAHQITENRAAAANKSSLPLMAMELCSSSNTYNDTLLFATLKNCVSGNDCANSNYCDPATLARCQEALTIREFCVDEGFFMVANLVSSSLLNSNSNGGVLDIIGNGDQFCTNLIHELT